MAKKIAFNVGPTATSAQQSSNSVGGRAGLA
jgi:hypothetical protein